MFLFSKGRLFSLKNTRRPPLSGIGYGHINLFGLFMSLKQAKKGITVLDGATGSNYKVERGLVLYSREGRLYLEVQGVSGKS